MLHRRVGYLLTVIVLAVPASLSAWTLSDPASATAAPVTCSTLALT